MAGGQPYHPQSPTQSSHFVPYSPTNKPQGQGQYQRPPQTPPGFGTAPLSQSPHFDRQNAISSPPLMNGSGHHHQSYSVNHTSPQQYSAPHFANNTPTLNGHSSYNNSTPGSHAHPSGHRESIPPSPSRDYPNHSVQILNRQSESSPPEPKPVRNDPMSFASILSEPTPEAPPAELKVLSVSKTVILPELKAPPPKPEVIKQEREEKMPDIPPPPPPKAAPEPKLNGHKSTFIETTPKRATKPRKILTAKESESISQAVEALDNRTLSDIGDEDGFSLEKEVYSRKRKRRAQGLQEQDDGRRKRRRGHLVGKMLRSFAARNSGASDRFRAKYEDDALAEIHNREAQADKERKKDNQRKRRRENTVKAEKEKLGKAVKEMEQAEDAADKEILQKEVDRARRRIKTVQAILDGGPVVADDSAEVQPASNLDGGTTSTFHLQITPDSPEPPKKKAKASGPSTRPKKSKEKKQAEKDAAEAAYAAMERDELVKIAPKQDPRKDSIKRATKPARATKEATPVVTGTNFESKGYQQIFESIWKDMAKKDIPRAYRIQQASLATRRENLRKTAQLAAKQARKWQERTNKSNKEIQSRSKRTMREMMTFWKKNEREERELRKLAEKKELEDAKKAEADREANRQKRKLNFLISQTEIYSHFIRSKIKTDEVERATDDPEVAAKTLPNSDETPTVALPGTLTKTKVTKIEDVNFDEEDETARLEAAAGNAQNAIQDMQDKARAFNKGGDDQMAAFDDSEMNFQNPSSLGDRHVDQPKMLQALLKEYQLKGLNWLVNLYEQGINGILADEMGLGKTIQAISLMAYLAEHHDIWGPFLVIAPTSTLYNWQQEIARFVPGIKVLPYWGSAKDRKVLRKFWDRKHITYTKDSEFHVLVTSYQLVVQDAQYFQRIKWQYMILDEAQAIKSSNSSRWKNLLGFECRNRLLLTGTPIQNNMQELWALLHFIMPTLFDSHDEFSDWFSKDIESHAQSNTKLNQGQLKRLHVILKPFMLRRVKAHVQKELGDKIETDVFCDLTYRQRAYYGNLRSRISIMDLIEKATIGDDQDTATLMNLVMQFRKVCNHPDLFERAEVTSPFSMSHFAETASFLREGSFVNIGYSVRNLIEYDLPRILCDPTGRIDMAGRDNPQAGFRSKILGQIANIWDPSYLNQSSVNNGAFSFLRFVDTSCSQAARCARTGLFERAAALNGKDPRPLSGMPIYDDCEGVPALKSHMFNIVGGVDRSPLAEIDPTGHLGSLMNISRRAFEEEGYATMEPAISPGASAPPIQICAADQNSITERQHTIFNTSVRQALLPLPAQVEEAIFTNDVDLSLVPTHGMLPEATSRKGRYTNLSVPSMRRFVTDSGKLANLDQLLHQLKSGGHRVLLYFQMTKMIDLMEEYLTYRNYTYCRLDGSTKLEDRRDTVHDFQTRPEIFIFLLSTRAGGLGINLTAADTVIFYDSDWNPTIDSQAMDRAHRLGQTRQVTVYRMITRGTIEERIRKRALQKEEVQRVVITGQSNDGVDFNTRPRENRTKDIAMWLANDDEAAMIEQREKEEAERPEEEIKRKKPKKAGAGGKRRRGEMSLDDMYHEGEGHFEDASAKPSGTATPVSVPDPPTASKKGRGTSKKAKTPSERLRMIDADGDLGMGGT